MYNVSQQPRMATKETDSESESPEYEDAETGFYTGEVRIDNLMEQLMESGYYRLHPLKIMGSMWVVEGRIIPREYNQSDYRSGHDVTLTVFFDDEDELIEKRAKITVDNKKRLSGDELVVKLKVGDDVLYEEEVSELVEMTDEIENCLQEFNDWYKMNHL